MHTDNLSFSQQNQKQVTARVRAHFTHCNKMILRADKSERVGGPRGRPRKNWRKDLPCCLPSLPSTWSTVELATSRLRTGPPTSLA